MGNVPPNLNPESLDCKGIFFFLILLGMVCWHRKFGYSYQLAPNLLFKLCSYHLEYLK